MDTEIKLIHFPKILDERGNLSFLECPKNFPFEIKRTYWIYDVPGGVTRGSHAFKNTYEVIIALSGSFDAVLHTGNKEYTFQLNRSYYGLFVPAMTWRTLQNFSTNALALVIANTPFDISEYIRDFNEFIETKIK